MNIKIGQNVVVNADESSFKAVLNGHIISKMMTDDVAILCFANRNGVVVNFFSDGRVEMLTSPRAVGNYLGLCIHTFIRHNDFIDFGLRGQWLRATKNFVFEWTGETNDELMEAFAAAKEFKRLLSFK